jgi:protein SCO1/2
MFGFTHCQDICPASLQKLRSFKLSSTQLRPVRVLMISVDGERDTAPQMKQYLSQYSQDFIGVTGDPERVRDIAERFSAVFFKGQPRANSGNYDVAHNRQVYAIDKSGQVRAEFYDASLEAMQGVMLALLKE